MTNKNKLFIERFFIPEHHKANLKILQLKITDLSRIIFLLLFFIYLFFTI